MSGTLAADTATAPCSPWPPWPASLAASPCSPIVVEEQTGTPLRPVFCLKRRDADMKELEAKYDCFILDFDDPFNTIRSKVTDLLSVSEDGDDDELTVVAEKGQVACRDYPHPRHLCLKYPFDKTPHDSYCKSCYCYVCDTAAPCTFWVGVSGDMAHCHASENVGHWKGLRFSQKGTRRFIGEPCPATAT